MDKTEQEEGRAGEEVVEELGQNVDKQKYRYYFMEAKTNTEILEKLEMKRELVRKLNQKQVKYCGHIKNMIFF